MPGTFVFSAPPHGEEPGAFLSRVFAEQGEATRILLARRSVWDVTSAIKLGAADQELATEGYPLDDADKAHIRTVGESAMAIATGASRTRLRNLWVDGCEPQFGSAKVRDALVLTGGPGHVGNVVDSCVLQHTRGWTCCHVFDHCVGAQITNNRVGPSGLSPAWADGLSLACRDGFVANNTIIDATDGAIVVFCCPGTVIVANTIITRTRECLGGINAVDSGPYDSDYTNTRIIGNRILVDGPALLKLGIGIGSRPWGHGEGVGAYGGFVCDNVFGPGTMGYAMAIGGCRDMTVHGNRIAAGTVFAGNTTDEPWNPAPQPFVRMIPLPDHPDETLGDVQDDFVPDYFRYLIGVKPGHSKIQRHAGGSLTLRAGQAVELQGAYVALLADGHLVVDVKGAGRVWSSPHPGRVVDPVASFTRDGRLLITDGNRVVWDATASIAAVPPPDRPPLVRTVARLTLSDEAPYISLTDEWSNVRFAAVSRWVPNGFRLGAGCYIALHADVDELARPPTSASPTTWLVLQATDSEIVLHTGVRPFEYAEHDVVWRAGIWRDPKPSADPSIEEGGTSLVFQWDGNLVLYLEKGGGAAWASSTNGGDGKLYFTLHGAIEPGGARIDLIDERGAVQWSTARK